MNHGLYETRRPESASVSKRLLALDALRGLAVIGMYVQHFALNQWNDFVSGNTMILFMLCSGISYSLMMQSMQRRQIGAQQIHARVLARAAFIDFVAYALIMLNGPFGLVLQSYAMLFLLALPLVRCSTKVLTIICAASFLLCPPLMLTGMSLFEKAYLLYDLAGGPGSALAWLPVFTVGMILGRMDLRRPGMTAKIAITGAVILIPVKLFSELALPHIYDSFCNWLAGILTSTEMPEPYAPWPQNVLPPMWQMLFIDAPQGGSAFELLNGVGGCLILLAALLALERIAGFLLPPLAYVGKSALSLYCPQVLLAWIMMLLDGDPTSVAQFPLGDLVVALILIAMGWLLSRFKNGPVEWALRRFEGLFYQEPQRT